MDGSDIPGFTAPVHRALTEPILLAGAPRAIGSSGSGSGSSDTC